MVLQVLLALYFVFNSLALYFLSFVSHPTILHKLVFFSHISVCFFCQFSTLKIGCPICNLLVSTCVIYILPPSQKEVIPGEETLSLKK